MLQENSTRVEQWAEQIGGKTCASQGQRPGYKGNQRQSSAGSIVMISCHFQGFFSLRWYVFKSQINEVFYRSSASGSVSEGVIDFNTVFPGFSDVIDCSAFHSSTTELASMKQDHCILSSTAHGRREFFETGICATWCGLRELG
jgi:hypothetical protein